MTLISLAPLQGYTDFVFRNALAQHIGGVDKFYTPYLRLQNDGTLKNSQKKDVNPDNNNTPVIPQILCNNAKDFLQLCHYLEELNYTEVNWNLGCPYPMVAKRKLGSGLIPYPELIDSIINECLPKTKLNLSVKIRLGYQNTNELEKVLPVLNQYPIKELIIHPRIGKDLYKKEAHRDQFAKYAKQTNLPLAYNGDITSKENAIAIIKENKTTNHLMIGRGLLKNPFLGLEISSNKQITDVEKREKFRQFYNDLILHYEQTLNGDSHQINKLIHLWEYLAQSFEESKKIYKRLKKQKSTVLFNNETMSIINNEPFK